MRGKGRVPGNAAAAVDALVSGLDHLAQGVMVIGPDHRIRAANQAQRAIFGFPKRLLKPGTEMADIYAFLAGKGAFGDADPAREVRKRLKALKDGTCKDEELALPDGRIVEIHRSSLPDGGLIAVATDVTEARRATRALAESEERLRDFADVASDWCWETDADLRFTFFSDRSRQTRDLPMVLGSRRQDLTADDVDSDKWRAHLADLAARRPFREFRYGIRTKDGRVRHIAASGKPVFDAAGAFAGYRGVGRDVTPEQEAERRLQQSLSLMQATLDATGDAILVSDLETRRIVAWNRRLVEMFRIPDSLLANFDSRKLANWIARQSTDRKAFLADVERIFAEPHREFRTTLRLKDGRYIERYSLPQHMDGRIVGRVVSLRDVTGRETAVAELQAQKNLMETVFRDVPDAMVVADAARRITMCNPAFTRIFGFTPKETLGRTTAFFYRDEAEYRHQGRLRYHPGAPELLDPYVAIYRRKNGELFPGETVGSPVTGRDGRTIGFVAVIRDVSAREKAEIDRRAALQMAEEANRAKSAFLANVSHDLRTPLNAVLGFAEVMRQEMLGPLGHAKYKEYARDIQNSGEYLLALVNDLLDISTIEAGQRRLAPEPIDLDDLMGECLKAAAGRVPGASAAVTASVARRLPMLTADRRAMKQVILNLLSNSLKFTPPTGTITLGARRRAGRFEIWVRDTGKGIPPKNLTRITTAFERGQTHAYSTADGTGLGLAIARSLVELHGGTLRIESQVGKGTQVTVSLPPDGPAAA